MSADDDEHDEDRDPSPAPRPVRRDRTGPKPRVISESDAMQLVKPFERAMAREREAEARARREAKVIELFGHDGNGGAFADMEEKMQVLEKKVAELEVFKVKTMMLFTVATTIGGAVASVVALLVDKLL